MEAFQNLADKLESPDEETRRLAVAALGSYPLEQVKGLLFRGLGDGSWRVRKEAGDALLKASFSGEVIEELIDMLRSHDNAGLRNSAMELLERLGEQAMPNLCRHADDPDHDVRKFVLDIMGNIGDATAVPLLVRALDDLDLNVSAAAAENLGKIGDPQAVPDLLRALSKPDIWFRHNVLESLGKIGRPAPVSAIIELASENLLKKAVFDCLGAIGDREAAPFLVEGLAERVRNAREAAAISLLKVRDRLAPDEAEQEVDSRLRALRGFPLIEGLLASMDTQDRKLKEALVRILAAIGDERAASRLLHACRDERLRSHCLQAFGNMGEAGAVSLLDAFSTADEDERCFIAYVCGELRYEGCAPLLGEGMRDASPMLRRVSALAAGKMGLASVLEDIVPLLDDSEPEVRKGAIEALSLLAEHERSTVLTLAQMLVNDKLPEKRRDAAILLAALKDVEKLSLLIKDEDAVVRMAAVSSLARLRATTSVGHLVMALVDENNDVRVAAAAALGEIGGPEVIEPLLLILQDDDPWVQCAALKSLGKLRDEQALQAIVRIQENADGMVMIAALEALAEIGGAVALYMVKQALDNPDEEVVKAAVNILASCGDDWLEEYVDKLLAHYHWDVRSSFVKVMTDIWGDRALPYLKVALARETDDLVRGRIMDAMDRLQ